MCFVQTKLMSHYGPVKKNLHVCRPLPIASISRIFQKGIRVIPCQINQGWYGSRLRFAWNSHNNHSFMCVMNTFKVKQSNSKSFGSYSLSKIQNKRKLCYNWIFFILQITLNLKCFHNMMHGQIRKLWQQIEGIWG